MGSLTKLQTAGLFVLASFLLFGSINSSQAQITIGLDNGTKDIFNQLPEEIRKQMFKLIQDARPLIDESVKSYLDKIDEIIHKNVEDGLKGVQCTAVGLGAQLKDSTKASLAGVFFVNPKNLTPPSVPDPLAELSTAISQTRDNIRASTQAKDIILAYADLLQHVAVVNCETKIAVLPVANEVKAQTDRLYLPAIEWQTLIADRDRPWCSNPRDCIGKRRDQILTLMTQSDSRDSRFKSKTDSFDAIEVFKSLPEPKPPSILDGLIYSSRIPILEYETLLANLRHIERVIVAQKTKRKEAAKNLLDDATKKRDGEINLLKGATGNFYHPSNPSVDSQETVDRCSHIISTLPVAVATAQQALDLDKDLRGDFDTLKSTADKGIDDAKKLKGVAQAKLEELRQQAIQQIRNEMVQRRTVR